MTHRSKFRCVVWTFARPCTELAQDSVDGKQLTVCVHCIGKMACCISVGTLLAAIVTLSLPPTPILKFDFQKECLALGSLLFQLLPVQARSAKWLTPFNSTLSAASSWLLKTSAESGSWLTSTIAMATTELPACFAVVPIPRLDIITFMIFVVILGFALVLLRTVATSKPPASP